MSALLSAPSLGDGAASVESPSVSDPVTLSEAAGAKLATK